jgi:hypothetical protein
LIRRCVDTAAPAFLSKAPPENLAFATDFCDLDLQHRYEGSIWVGQRQGGEDSNNLITSYQRIRVSSPDWKVYANDLIRPDSNRVARFSRST